MAPVEKTIEFIVALEVNAGVTREDLIEVLGQTYKGLVVLNEENSSGIIFYSGRWTDFMKLKLSYKTDYAGAIRSVEEHNYHEPLWKTK